MKRIADHTAFMEREFDCVRRLLDEWKPRSFDVSEKEQEMDLQAWLQSNLPDVPIVSQYGIAKGKADLVIQDEYVVELKLAFTDENLVEFDRCIGQMERYRQKWVSKDRGLVFLVVVGKSGSEFRDMLHEAFKQFNTSTLNNYFFITEKQE